LLSSKNKPKISQEKEEKEREKEEEEESLGVAGRHVARAAKALVVSEPIAIFHPGDGKS